MQQNEDTFGEPIKASIGDQNEADPARTRDRFERAVRGLEEPKSPKLSPAFRNLTIEERNERLLMVELLANEYLSADEITDFLPAWGVSVPRSRVYTYLASVRLPRGYKRIVERRSRRLHDGLAVYHLIRIARDAYERGLKVERVLVARKLHGFGIIPDVNFFIRYYGFFLEEQLAPLPDTRWRDKLRAYLKRCLATGDKARVLFICNDRSDIVRARRYARELLTEHDREGLKIFLFIEQVTMKGSRNVVYEPVWQTPWGNAVSLVDWLRLPGESPTAQC